MKTNIKEIFVSLFIISIPLMMAAGTLYFGVNNASRDEDLFGLPCGVRAEDTEMQVWSSLSIAEQGSPDPTITPGDYAATY